MRNFASEDSSTSLAPRPVRVVSNYISDYTPPLDVHKEEPAAKTDEKVEEKVDNGADTDDRHDSPKRPSSMTSVESRFYKFGIPEPSATRILNFIGWAVWKKLFDYI